MLNTAQSLFLWGISYQLVNIYSEIKRSIRITPRFIVWLLKMMLKAKRETTRSEYVFCLYIHFIHQIKVKFNNIEHSLSKHRKQYSQAYDTVLKN